MEWGKATPHPHCYTPPCHSDSHPSVSQDTDVVETSKEDSPDGPSPSARGARGARRGARGT